MFEDVEIRSPKLLVVEGKDEVNFFDELLKSENFSGIQILDVGGKDNIRAGLKAIALAPNFKELVTTLGIVRDADDDHDSAFRTVQAALKAASLDIPKAVSVATSGRPKISVFILPKKNTLGSLEDLCIASASRDPALRCVDEFVACLGARSVTFSRSVAKVKTQVLLSSRVNDHGMPVRNVGEAARSKQWDWANPAFAELKEYAANAFR